MPKRLQSEDQRCVVVTVYAKHRKLAEAEGLPFRDWVSKLADSKGQE